MDEGSLVGLSPQPVESDATPQVYSVRIVGDPAGVPRELLAVGVRGTSPHTYSGIQ